MSIDRLLIQTTSDGSTVKALWRYSLDTPSWRANWSTSVDFSTMVMGYALKYLPQNFYQTYSVGSTQEPG